MNPIELTISEVKTATANCIKVRRQFEEAVDNFMQRFKGQDCLNNDVEEDDVSMEFKESFFKLMEAKNLLSDSVALANEFCRSLEFVKSQEVNYRDSGQYTRTERLHEFLMENVSIGGESEWKMLFRVPPQNIANMICYMDGNVFYRASLEDVRLMYHETVGYSNTFDGNDFFPEGCWAEVNAFALVTPENAIVRISK